VAFTPAEAVSAQLGIVVDVMRATSTIAQALASGYRRVLCCAEIDEARRLREELGEAAITGGEREAQRIPGFDAGASPREFLEPRAETLILSTTNGTRAIVSAADSCGEVVLGSLRNLGAVASSALARGEDTVVVCSGYKDSFAIDDAYCAGRIVALLEADRRHQRAHLRPARPRGRHRVVLAGGRARRRAALHADGRHGSRGHALTGARVITVGSSSRMDRTVSRNG